MGMSVLALPRPAEPVRRRALWLSRLVRRRATVVGLVLLAVTTLVGVLAPVIAGDPLRVEGSARLTAPRAARGAHRTRLSAGDPRDNVRGGGARARRFRRRHRRAPRAAELSVARDRAGLVRVRRRRAHGGGAVVPRCRRAALRAVVGQHPGRGPPLPAAGAVARALSRRRHHAHDLRPQPARRWTARPAGPAAARPRSRARLKEPPCLLIVSPTVRPSWAAGASSPPRIRSRRWPASKSCWPAATRWIRRWPAAPPSTSSSRSCRARAASASC